MPDGEGGAWADELAVAKDVVRVAAAAIMRFYEHANAGVYAKADDSPVTDADLAADRLIRERIGARFPDDALLTEEGADDPTRPSKRRCWIADPIDGTQQFVDRTGEFDVFLALVVDGRPVVGVSGHPPSGQMLWAVDGAGAWIEEDREARRLSFVPPASGTAPRVATGHYHGAPGNCRSWVGPRGGPERRRPCCRRAGSNPGRSRSRRRGCPATTSSPDSAGRSTVPTSAAGSGISPPPT